MFGKILAVAEDGVRLSKVHMTTHLKTFIIIKLDVFFSDIFTSGGPIPKIVTFLNSAWSREQNEASTGLMRPRRPEVEDLKDDASIFLKKSACLVLNF